jgi:hypothetical protein
MTLLTPSYGHAVEESRLCRFRGKGREYSQTEYGKNARSPLVVGDGGDSENPRQC